MKKSEWGDLPEKGVDGVDVSFTEHLEVKWGGWRDFSVVKDTPCRVPPRYEILFVVSCRFASLQRTHS